MVARRQGNADLRSAQRAEGPRAAHRHSRRWFPSRRSLHQAPRCHRQGNADLRPVLPVGAGTAGRRPAGGASSSALTARRTPSLSPASSPRHPVSAAVPGSCSCSAPTATAESSRDVGLTAAGDPDQLPVVRRAGNDLDRIPRHPQQLREEGNEVGVRLAPLRRRRDVGADLPARKPSDPLRGGAGSGPDPQHHALERTRVRHGGILERRRASTANAGGASAGLWAR